MPSFGATKTHWTAGPQSASELQAPPSGIGFIEVAATQVKAPVMSATHFKPAQHGAEFAPQLVPSVALHAQNGLTKSPWARCAGTAFVLTLITCALFVL